ncbi:hypothetical protein [Pinibacter aurantiacus]|uniref:DUF4595 domain-containing protein n=1 Tax=Pinibacter aurantiacus TaxID=2851599 RepID=A0A9E2W8B4_9BACT|nr:hypothetical protein [Pinibacter aurantiacus]MBV4358276.1 hypothetical protein [Pinibacter aurantiacus]
MMRLLLFIGIATIITFSSCQKELFFDKIPTLDSTRLLPSSIVDNSVSNDSIKIEYDNLNRIISCKKFYKDYLGVIHGDTITYTYDDNNRLIMASSPFGGESYESVYSYNDRTITETTTWLKHNPANKSVTTLTLNGNKHLAKAEDADGETEYTYDNYGNQIGSSFVNSSFSQSITTRSTYTMDSAMLRCVNAPLWFLESKPLFVSYIIKNISGFNRKTVSEESGRKETYVETGEVVYEMNQNGFPLLIHTTINGQETSQKITYVIAK